MKTKTLLSASLALIFAAGMVQAAPSESTTSAPAKQGTSTPAGHDEKAIGTGMKPKTVPQAGVSESSAGGSKAPSGKTRSTEKDGNPSAKPQAKPTAP